MSAASDSDPLWPQLAVLFDALLDLDEDARFARLAELDAGSPELAQRLRALLKAQLRTHPGLERGGAASQAGQANVAFSRQAGQRLGGFVLRERLGAGGMGEVWLAERQEGALRQRVAMKCIRADLGGSARQRFAREVAILARLSHPNIARFIDSGIDDQDAPWLAMEYVEGQPLGRYCEARQLSPAQRVRLLLPVLEALDHAHRQLVVHRDLKPGNLLVDPEGRVRLLDFGIAKLLDADFADEFTGTHAPAPLTPRYAAPEQLAGSDVGTAADVYSAGVLLFELLSGSLPRNDAALRSGREAISLWKAYSGADSVPRYAQPQPALRRLLRGELQQILGRALALEPAERYPSAAAFAADLECWLQQRPLLSRPTPWPRRLSKWTRRQPLAAFSLLLALLAVAVGSGFSLWQAREASERAAQAEAARRFLGEVFAAADPELHGDEPPQLADLIGRGAERLRVEAGLDPRSRLLLLQDLGHASLGLDRIDDAASLLSEAESLRTRAHLSDQESRALMLDLVALELKRDAAARAGARLAALPLPAAGRAPSSLDLRDLGLRVQRALAGTRPEDALRLLEPYLQSPLWQAAPVRAELLAAAARAELQAGRLREGLATLEAALEALPAQAPLILRLGLYEAEVEARRGLGEIEPALQRQRTVIDLLEARLGPAHARSLWARMLLCGLLIPRGELAEADREYSRVMAALGPGPGRDSLRGEALFGWGMVAFRRGEFALARQRFETAQKHFLDAFGSDSHKTRNAAEAAAMAQVEDGAVDTGLAALRVQVQQSRALGDAPRLLGQLNSLALALITARQPKAALPLLAESRALSMQLQQPDWWTRVIEARALRASGRSAAAIELIEPVVETYRNTLSPQGGPRRAEAERELALALLAESPAQRERALQLLDSVLEQRRRFLGEDSPLSRISAQERVAAAH